VALVHVEHGGPERHGLQRAHSADSQDNLLADPRVHIAAVKLVVISRISGRVFSGILVSSR